MTPESSAKSRVFLISVILLLLAACAAKPEHNPVIFTNGEELHGSWDDADQSMAVFRGIPFAAPPTGDMRWRAPIASQPRPGPQKATEFAPACMQTSYTTDWYASVAEAFGPVPDNIAQPNGVSEDCLYLNVWSSLPGADAALPVLVWVHGGSNKGGWSYEPNYEGARLAAKGVVVVSIAYRLGSFGFFSHPALDNGEGEPIANFGLLDIDRAVRWVADNIQAFGGNPGNITLIGESAGAGDISDLVTVKLTSGTPYQKIILQSSASGFGERRTLADEMLTGQRLVESLGVKGEVTADQLRSIPAQDLLSAYMTGLPDHYFDAVVDGLTMKQSPFEALESADKTSLDILIGTNEDEWYMYIDEDAGQAELEKTIEQIAGDQAPALMAKVSHFSDPRKALDRIETARYMLCPSRYLAARVTALGGLAYVYHFTRQREGSGGEQLGVYHGAEIPYVFDTHDSWLPMEDADQRLSEAIMDYWVQFAHSGTPNLPDRPEWPRYEGQNPQVMELGDRVAATGPNDLGLCEWLGPLSR